MVLTGNEIEKQISEGKIKIHPFTSDYVGANSVDLRLADDLLVYDLGATGILDTNKEPRTTAVDKGSDGSFLLLPNKLYLGRTVESISSDHYVPIVEGRSSIGRFGIQVHMTAGVCDLGFSGTITLEITSVHPVKIYPNQRICQVLWLKSEGARRMYAGRYQNQKGATPSRMSWSGFLPKPGKIPNCS